MSQKTLFDLQNGETIVRDEVGVWIKGGISNVMGHVYLTNKRLIFIKSNPFLFALFGLLGFLLESLTRKWLVKIVIDLPLKNITHFENTKFGFNKNVVLFQSLEGEFKIGMNRPYSEWEPVLKAHLKH